jgi:hypothetical protein
VAPAAPEIMPGRPPKSDVMSGIRDAPYSATMGFTPARDRGGEGGVSAGAAAAAVAAAAGGDARVAAAAVYGGSGRVVGDRCRQLTSGPVVGQ